MASLLFLSAVAAFVLVAWWAYDNDRLGVDEPSRGLLRVKIPEDKVVEKPAATPKSRQVGPNNVGVASSSAPSPATDGRPEPRWKRSHLRKAR